MRSFQETFETRNRSFISAFSISMTAPLTSIVSEVIRKPISAEIEVNYRISSNKRLWRL